MSMAQWGKTESTESDEQPIRSQRIFAPWTDEQVAALNNWQETAHVHPFTCGGSVHDGNTHGERPTLVANTDGWTCPEEHCNWRQNWAHAFMADPNVLTNREDALNQALGQFFDAQAHRARAIAARQAQHVFDATTSTTPTPNIRKACVPIRATP